MAVKNLRQFQNETNRFAKTLVPQMQVRFHKKVAFEALRLLILITPVDEGRARNNWQTSIDSSSEEEVENWKSVNPSFEHFSAVSGLQPFQTIFLSMHYSFD